jgi:hypothetical protein
MPALEIVRTLRGPGRFPAMRKCIVAASPTAFEKVRAVSPGVVIQAGPTADLRDLVVASVDPPEGTLLRIYLAPDIVGDVATWDAEHPAWITFNGNTPSEQT